MKPDINKLTKEMFKDWQPIMFGKMRIGWGKDFLTEDLAANEIEEHTAQQLALNAEIEKVKARIDERETMWRSLVLNKAANHKIDKDYRLGILKQELSELERMKG